MEKYIMALDQGTTSSRCIIFDRAGNIAAMSQKEFKNFYPKAGWVEQDPEEIWSSQLEVARQALLSLGENAAERIAAIGITNQRETTIVWERQTGKPVYPAIVWQCRRTAGFCEKMQDWQGRIQKKTGLRIDPYFSATKLAWILDQVEGARERAERGELLFGTVDTWLLWNLSGGKIHATDYSNASRTMMYNIHTLTWDEEILEYLGIPLQMLPGVQDSSGFFGETEKACFGRKIPITGVAGDQQSSLFGQCCFQPGEVKNTYGTGGFLLMNTGERCVDSKNGLLTTIAWGLGGKITYALEGSIFMAGATIQWLRDKLGLISHAAETERAALSIPDAGGVYLVPAFAGLGAPYWDSHARGAIVGLTQGTEKTHIIRAALESLAYQTVAVMHAMREDSGVELKGLKVDGGACANDFLLQFQSDILDLPLVRPNCIETTALGAAYLSGLGAGYYKSREDIAANWQPDSEFTPQMLPGEREKHLKGWEEAVRRVRTEKETCGEQQRSADRGGKHAFLT